jgi:hypothetical protein
MNNIHDSLSHLCVDIETLIPLESNPRRGDVDAIASSYLEFGQIKPIVIRPNDDGTATVIAGNHQVLAAKKLGWDKIAAVPYEVDNTRAIAFAIADNRTMELGYTEPDILNEVILEIGDVYPELIEGLGWDEFEFAELEQKAIRQDNQVVGNVGTYVPPTIQSPTSVGNGFGYSDEDDDDDEPQAKPVARLDMNAVSLTKDRDGRVELNVRPGVDQADAAIRGSTIVSPSSAPQAVVQYTIVFDTPQQQARWYEFIKWLKTDPAIAGVTTAERLIDFIDQHIEI